MSKQVTDKDGNTKTVTFKQPKAVSARMINVLLSVLNTRAAKAWSLFDCYLEILYSFGVHSADEVENESL